MLEKINVGIVGACGRGSHFRESCDAIGSIRVHAVCDVNAEGLSNAATILGASEQYSNYEEMLEKSEIDAVIVASPMQFHAEQSIAALERGIHVLSEVTAAVSIEECKRLVAAASASKALYMMAENYTYIRSNAIVRELVRRGEFGTPYYAEGEYIHELKALNEVTKWRRKWQTGIAGITYGTHSLGPILQWMPNDRVVSVCCAGSGHHYTDPRGENYAPDLCVMLGKMRSGGLCKIRLDMLSDRPEAASNYQLQGTDGCYESARSSGEPKRIWLRSKCKDMNTWLRIEELEDDFLPEMWRKADEKGVPDGHGGGDYFEIVDFAEAIAGTRPLDIGIHEAMDMTLPGLVSQQSMAADGAWMPVPDSRDWV